MSQPSRDGSMMGPDEYFDQPNADGTPDGGSGDDDLHDDLIDDYADATPATVQQAQHDLQPIPNGGPLLEEPDAKKIFRTIDKEVMRQERLAKNRDETKKHWDAVDSGAQFSILEKSEDLSIVKQLFPPGIEGTPQPIPNKVADLKKKIISQILVDPPMPDPKPDGADSDKNRGAADLTKKFLRNDGTPTGTNDLELFREALNTNMTGASAFAWVWVDKTGGGWRPKQVKAHPQATDANNPLVGPKLGPDDQPIMVNGQPITERTTDPILRYVAEAPDEGGDGGDPEGDPESDTEGDDAPTGAPRYVFTNDPSAAARQWMPKVVRRLLPPAMVRMHPPTCNAFNAPAITVLAWESWGEAKRLFPILATLNKDQAKQLCGWRPKRWKAIVPEAMRPKGGDVSLTGGGEVADDMLFFWYHRFCRIGESYQDGGEVAVTGGNENGKDGFLLRRDTLREDVEVDDGTKVPVLMFPPISQFLALHDTKGGDPFGIAPMGEFAGANDMYAHLYVSVLDAIDKGLHPNVYLPSTSPVTREDYNRRDGTPIDILVPEDKPYIEEAPQIPSFTPQMIDKVEAGMNSAAGTNETSNGLDSAYAASGVAKEVAIRQAKVALAQYWQNTIMGITYYWMIKTQLAQARLTVPQQVMLAGVESSIKQKWWVGADLLGVSQIPLAAGTGTMMTAPEKLQDLNAMQTAGWLTKERAGDVARSSMADDLGLPPDPHEEHVDQQIGVWIEGPPPGWEDTMRQNAQQQEQYTAAIQQRVAVLTSQGIDPQTAQQQAQQQIPQPQPAPVWTPFEPRPNDDEPGVAATRVMKFSRGMSTPDYKRQPPAWRAVYDDAYKRAFYSAGGKTVEQQAQEAQQAQAATTKGEADATYTQFMQDVQNKTMGIITTMLSKEVAPAVVPGAGAPTSAPTTSAPTAPAGPSPLELAASAASEHADRAHQAQEFAKDRQHEAVQNHHDRAASLAETVFKAAMDAHTKAQQSTARAEQQAAAAQPAATGALP